jgi:cytochrome c-type biogenesis protein CcmH/NrfG
VTRLSKATTDSPRQADAWCFLGTALLETGRSDEAKEALRLSLELNPEYVEAKKFLALAHYRSNDARESERLLNEAIELHQDYPDLHKILGDVRMSMGEIDGAKRAYSESLALNPHYSDALCAYVVALRREGNGREADAMLSEFVERHPTDLLARTLLTVEKMKLPDA